MKKHYILFQAFPPLAPDNQPLPSPWRSKVNDAINTHRPTEDTIPLGDNAWLLPRNSNMHLLAALIAAADTNRVPCEIRFLCDEDDETTPSSA